MRRGEEELGGGEEIKKKWVAGLSLKQKKKS